MTLHGGGSAASSSGMARLGAGEIGNPARRPARPRAESWFASPCPAATIARSCCAVRLRGGCGAEDGSVRLGGQRQLTGCDIAIGADPSSAAFPLVAAAIVPGSDGRGPRHDGQSAAHRPLRGAGGDGCGHRLVGRAASSRARSSPISASARRRCRPCQVGAEQIPAMIDEIPVLAVACAFADGESVIEGLGRTARQGERPAGRDRRRPYRLRGCGGGRW